MNGIMRHIVIVANESVFDRHSNNFSIGGVQTYIKDLCEVAKLMNAKCTLALISKSEDLYSKELNGFNVETSHCSRLFKSLNQATFNFIYHKYNNKHTVFIIATDQMTIKSKASNVLSIQHGIAFDDEVKNISGLWNFSFLTKRIFAHLRAEFNLRRGKCVPNIVCVDYNFFNWVRTMGDISTHNNYTIILNHTSLLLSIDQINKKLEKKDGPVKIIFARRFVPYRGSRIFANVVSKLINEKRNIQVTFAGEGPMETELKERFKNNDSVSFIKFAPEDSVKVHENYDIAVVPTIFSEGSSLSLAEAMSAGCFPIASHVGGMTNMILDGYNGYLIYPSEEDLYNAILKAIELPKDEFHKIQLNAFQTAQEALCLKKWQSRWIELIEKGFNH